MEDRFRFYRDSAARDLEDLRRRFEYDVARPVIRTIWERLPEEMKGWSPAVDVFQKGDNIIVKVEMPGVKQDDVDISASNDTLTIKGTKKAEPGVKDNEYSRSEIIHGNFVRTVNLPAAVDTDNVDAVYEDGIVRITMPVASGSKPKKVPIKVKKAAAS
jgi:HSP20 family protein